MNLSVFILPGLEAIGSNNLFFYFAPWTLQLKIAWVKAIDMQYKYFFSSNFYIDEYGIFIKAF